MSDQSARAIWMAAKSGDLGALRELVGGSHDRLHAQTPFGTPLHVASSRGDLAMVKALLEWGADINAKGGTYKGSALNEAAASGHVEVVRLLLERNAEIDLSAPERNPLWGAVHDGYEEVVKVLIQIGVDSLVSYDYGNGLRMTVLEFALERGHQRIADSIRLHRAAAQPALQADAAAPRGLS